MSDCPYHRNLCAYPDWSPDRCEYCHASWAKITAPDTYDKAGLTAYLPGYGQMPLNHLWGHIAERARLIAKNDRTRGVA